MKIVLIGDVSWNGQYHLGDEAMTEVAVNQLKRHGAEITLIAGDPELSAHLYDVKTVPRLGFRDVPRPRKLKLLDAMHSGLVGRDQIPKEMLRTILAVQDADAVVIAGGGNLNTSGEHHLFERLALKRIAEHANVPLFVTSQTVGPHLSKEDREVVKEIVDYATVFGVREQTSAKLMRQICADPKKIVLTFDDAVLLPASMSAAQARNKFNLPERFVIGSFTFHPGSTGMSATDYYQELALALDQIVETADVDIVFIPHIGFLESTAKSEQDSRANSQITTFMTSQRVHELPVISAGDTVALTSGAQFTLSTRYHPVVFGPAVAVPAIGLVTSQYSRVRMGGALQHVGMETFAIPFEAWNSVLGSRMVQSLTSQQDDVRTHLLKVREMLHQYQEDWWDGIAGYVNGTSELMKDKIPSTESFEWGSAADQEHLAIIRSSHDALNRIRSQRSHDAKAWKVELKQLQQEIKLLEREVIETRVQVSSLQKSMRKEIDELRHKQRPIGASMRDNVRLKLQKLRKPDSKK